MYTGFVVVKNITLTADAALIEAARKRASDEQTTLNEAFRRWLEEYAGRKAQAQRARAVWDDVLTRAGLERQKFTRDEMNER